MVNYKEQFQKQELELLYLYPVMMSTAMAKNMLNVVGLEKAQTFFQNFIDAVKYELSNPDEEDFKSEIMKFILDVPSELQNGIIERSDNMNENDFLKISAIISRKVSAEERELLIKDILFFYFSVFTCYMDLDEQQAGLLVEDFLHPQLSLIL
ncbi:MAG: hypothetical protein LBC89_04200 [Bacteroidales bacterium]|jgi:hypothetical protein|nr:hypothetical protein [Bacteroidales bacterium]